MAIIILFTLHHGYAYKNMKKAYCIGQEKAHDFNGNRSAIVRNFTKFK